MQFIDALIQFSALLSAGWLAVEFIRFSFNRGSGRRVAPDAIDPDEDELFNALADFGPDVAAGLMTEREAVEIGIDFLIDQESDNHAVHQHRVVPFQRPATRREPSNRELIQLAKLHRDRFPQAAKWSFNRKLSRPVRSELLQLWNGSEESA